MMKAILLAKTASLLDALHRSVEAEGYKVTRALLRAPGQSLLILLDGAAADLLIVDCAHEDVKNDLAALESMLSQHAAMDIIMLSTSQNDPESLLVAMRAGVREMLPSPPSAPDLTAALHRITQRKPAPTTGADHGHIIAFMPSKGGSGSTFLATNLAHLLATEFNQNTLLIDLDLQYGDASYFLTDARSKNNLGNLARQMDRLDAKLLASSVHVIAPNFCLLAAPEDLEAAMAIKAGDLERVLELARESYDFVVLDVERMIDPALGVKALDNADLVFVVTQAMIPYVRNARHLVDLLRTLGAPDSKLRLLVNRYEKRGAIDLAQVEKAVGLKVDRTIPNSFSDVSESINTGVPLAKLNSSNAVVRSLRALANDLAEKPRSGRHGWLGRLIGGSA